MSNQKKHIHMHTHASTCSHRQKNPSEIVCLVIFCYLLAHIYCSFSFILSDFSLHDGKRAHGYWGANFRSQTVWKGKILLNTIVFWPLSSFNYSNCCGYNKEPFNFAVINNEKCVNSKYECAWVWLFLCLCICQELLIERAKEIFFKSPCSFYIKVQFSLFILLMH